MLNAHSLFARSRLAAVALAVAALLALLSLANAQAATDAPGEIGDRMGSIAVADLAESAHGSCVGEFAAISGSGGLAELDLSFWHYGVAHWQYPDADGNCPSGYTKTSVYNCVYDDNYNVTCGYEDRCYPNGN